MTFRNELNAFGVNRICIGDEISNQIGNRIKFSLRWFKEHSANVNIDTLKVNFNCQIQSLDPNVINQFLKTLEGPLTKDSSHLINLHRWQNSPAPAPAWQNCNFCKQRRKIINNNNRNSNDDGNGNKPLFHLGAALQSESVLALVLVLVRVLVLVLANCKTLFSPQLADCGAFERIKFTLRRIQWVTL